MSDDDATFRARIEESLALTGALLEPPYADFAVALAKLLADALRSGRKVIFCGNGGSAADSVHLAAEFVGRYRLDRDALPAIALSDNASTLTSVANDYDYSRVFERQVRALGAPGDVLVALSTSGASSNVIRAVEAAKEVGLVTVGVTGRDGGELARTAERCLRLPSGDTARIQEASMLVLHIAGELVEDELFGHP